MKNFSTHFFFKIKIKLTQKTVKSVFYIAVIFNADLLRNASYLMYHKAGFYKCIYHIWKRKQLLKCGMKYVS